MARFIVGVLAISILGFFVLRARREGQRGFTRYERAARVALAGFSLHEKNIPPSERLIKPQQTLGLITSVAHTATGERLQHVCIDDFHMAGFIRTLTLVLVPDYQYNLPIFTADVIFVGARRIMLVEVIDPVQIEAEHLKIGYQRFREHRSCAEALLPVRNVDSSAWAQDIVQDFSFRVTAHRDQDELLVQSFRNYLNTWLDMARQAQPALPEVQQKVREGIEGYVRTLLEQGGPAVDVLKRLLGPERQRRYVQTVMFGIAT
jgi:hypothetical protein